MVRIPDGSIATAPKSDEQSDSPVGESAFNRLLGFANAQLGSETILPSELPAKIRASALNEAKPIYAGHCMEGGQASIESVWVLKDENDALAGYAVNLRLSGVRRGADPKPGLFYDLSEAYLGWEHLQE